MQIHLNNSKQFLIKRNSDIQIFLSCMKNCKNIEETTIFKSSIMLMLYNEIEGTFSNILSELFDYIMDENIDFELLHNKIKNIYLEYYCKTINDTSNLMRFYELQDLKSVDYLELNKYLKLYSGNLDARQIRNISKRIGVSVSTDVVGEKLLFVKNCRNKLAHGEVSFQEACRDFSEDDIEKIVKEVLEFLNMLISDYNNFIDRQLVVSN